MVGCGFGEFIDNDGAGDAAVGGYRDREAGAVVEPAQNFDVGAGGQSPVGEVSLPAFVGLGGGEANIGRLGTFLRGGFDQAGAVEVAADGGGRDTELVVVLEVPGDGVWSGVEAFAC